MVDGMQLGEGFRVGFICGSKTLEDDSKTALDMPF